MSTSNAFATVEALRVVLREEQPAAMADVLLDMERARMTAEDYRGALETAHNEICRIQSILREEDEETSEDDEETSDDDGIRCIVCETVSSPDWFNIVPAGSLPDVAPGTRIVCGSCYAANPAIGEVDSFF